MDYPNFVGPSYRSQSLTADQEQLANWYTERMESPGATSRTALYPTPGVLVLGTASTSPGRAHFFQNGREFAVIGTSFVEIDISGTVITPLGTVASGTTATISSNGDGGGQLFITAGSNGYIFDLGSSVFTQVAALNGKATMGDFIDGYFLALDGTNSTLYLSSLLDGLTWNTGTAFAQRTSASDPWVAMKVNGRYVWLLGEQTSEVWYNTGASPFPLAPHPSGLIPHGIAAPFSVSVANGEIIWLGASKLGDSYVLKASGFTPEVISDYPQQNAINQYPIIEDAVADTYNDLGHTFYLLTFPTQKVTWAWDMGMNQWAVRVTWIAEDHKYVDWRPRWHVHAFGEHRMLDGSTGAVYRMSSDLGLDVDGRPIRRLRRAPALTAGNERIYFASFELDLEPGLGTSTGQGSNPMVMMRQSKDGGKTWGNERMCSAGKIGEYLKRVRWNRCGMARRMVFEIVCTDPIPWKITAAYLTLGQPIKNMPQKQGQQATA